MRSPPMLALIDIQAGYGRAALVLRGLTVAVPANTVVCLVGPNGAGKSTALKVASGLLAPRAGRIVLDGVEVTGLGPQRMLAAGLAHVLQGHSVFPEMTVAENVLLGAYTVNDRAVRRTGRDDQNVPSLLERGSLDPDRTSTLMLDRVGQDLLHRATHLVVGSRHQNA